MKHKKVIFYVLISYRIEGIIKSGGGEDKKATQAEFLAIIEKHFIGKPYKDAPGNKQKNIYFPIQIQK